MGKRPPWNEFRGLMSRPRVAARQARPERRIGALIRDLLPVQKSARSCCSRPARSERAARAAATRGAGRRSSHASVRGQRRRGAAARGRRAAARDRRRVSTSKPAASSSVPSPARARAASVSASTVLVLIGVRRTGRARAAQRDQVVAAVEVGARARRRCVSSAASAAASSSGASAGLSLPRSSTRLTPPRRPRPRCRVLHARGEVRAALGDDAEAGRRARGELARSASGGCTASYAREAERAARAAPRREHVVEHRGVELRGLLRASSGGQRRVFTAPGRGPCARRRPSAPCSRAPPDGRRSGSSAHLARGAARRPRSSAPRPAVARAAHEAERDRADARRAHRAA